MNNLIIIIGKTCSGKTTIVNEFIKRGYDQIVTYTTRPIRKNEIQDKTYHFISNKKFNEMLVNDEFAEFTSYLVANGETWYYGTAKKDLKPGKIIILNPEGLRAIKEKLDNNFISFYIDADENIISRRLLNRGDNYEEASRRIKSDRKDFYNIEEEVNYIIDGSKTVKNIVDEMELLIERRNSRG